MTFWGCYVKYCGNQNKKKPCHLFFDEISLHDVSWLHNISEKRWSIKLYHREVLLFYYANYFSVHLKCVFLSGIFENFIPSRFVSQFSRHYALNVLKCYARFYQIAICYITFSLILQLADSLIIINLWIVYDLPYVTADNLIRNRIKINVFSRRWFSFCLIIYRETLSKNYIILCQKSYSTSPIRNYHIWDFKAQEDWYLSECFL